MLIEPAELERKVNELRARLTEEEAGYLTGFIEGEGAFIIRYDKKANKYYPVIIVSNTDLNVLVFLKERAGIGTIQFRKSKSLVWKDEYMWHIWGSEAIILSKFLIGSLKSKKKRILSALLIALNKRRDGMPAEMIKRRVMELNNSVLPLNELNDLIKTRKRCKRNNMVLKNISSFDCGWLAGMLDAEGCLYIHKRLKKVELFIRNTDPYIIYYIANIVDGGHLRVVLRKTPRRAFYEWKLLKNKDVVKFLNLILDFLRIKSDRAQIIMEFCSTFKDKRYYWRLPPEILKMRKHLYEQLRLLNQKGRPPSLGPSTLAPAIPVLPFPLKWSLPRSLSLLDA